MDTIVFDQVSFHYENEHRLIFNDLSIRLDASVTSLLGQNGTGKSTFLLLAGGCVLPSAGRVFINNVDTAQFEDEEQRQKYVSFIFQNLEFESDQNIQTLLEEVLQNGFLPQKDRGILGEVIKVFELDAILKRKSQELSKGELQRAILAFSVLYGSQILIMDEPIFALEDYQKERALEYLSTYCREKKVPVYFCLHELDLSHKYSDHLLLFSRDKPPLYGKTADLFQKELIEQAYGTTIDFLKKKESLYRDYLISHQGH